MLYIIDKVGFSDKTNTLLEKLKTSLLNRFGGVVKLVNTSPCHGEDRRFESGRSCKKDLKKLCCCFTQSIEYNWRKKCLY